jgi:hypothetical protein
VDKELPDRNRRIEVFGGPAEEARPAVDGLWNDVSAAVDFVEDDDLRAITRPHRALDRGRVPAVFARQAFSAYRDRTDFKCWTYDQLAPMYVGRTASLHKK